MKHNFFAYFMYVVYLVLFFFLGKFLLYSPDRGFLLILSVWFVPPVVMALIPMIVVKRTILRYMLPTLKNPFHIAFLSTVQSIMLSVAFSILLALMASMVRMGFGDMPNFELWGISQTIEVITLEVFCLAGLFSWLTRFVEYHAVWHKIEHRYHARVRRILLYANIVNYILLIVFFIMWQFMIFYQVPEFLWKVV